MPAPPSVSVRLVGRTPRTRTIALLLHGGTGRPEPMPAWRDASFARMLGFVPDLLTGGRGRLAVAVTHHHGHGWLRRQPDGWDSADIDVGGALHTLVDHVSALVGPDTDLVVVGHSSGGWAAVHALTDPRVTGGLMLAPWLNGDEPGPARTDARTVVAHGTADRLTSPDASRRYAERLIEQGYHSRYIEVTGGDHAMLRPLPVWHRIVRQYARAVVQRR